MIQPFESYGITPGDSPAAATPQAIVELQRSYYQGEIPREAALAAAALLSGLTAEESENLFPRVPPVTPTPAVQMRHLVIALVLGISFGLCLGPMVAALVSGFLTGWNKGPDGIWRPQDADILLGVAAGAVLGGVMGIVVLLAFRRLSGYSRPMYLSPQGPPAGPTSRR
jgi:hypothetical protein